MLGNLSIFWQSLAHWGSVDVAHLECMSMTMSAIIVSLYSFNPKSFSHRTCRKGFPPGNKHVPFEGWLEGFGKIKFLFHRLGWVSEQPFFGKPWSSMSQEGTNAILPRSLHLLNLKSDGDSRVARQKLAVQVSSSRHKGSTSWNQKNHVLRHFFG